MAFLDRLFDYSPWWELGISVLLAALVAVWGTWRYDRAVRQLLEQETARMAANLTRIEREFEQETAQAIERTLERITQRTKGGSHDGIENRCEPGSNR